MDEELSTADPLAPNGGLLPNGTGNGLLKPCLFCRLAQERNWRGTEYSHLPNGTGNGLLKPCLFCRLARERNGPGAEYRRPAGPEWWSAARGDRERLTETLFMLQASTRTKWTRSWVPPTRWPRMAACCPTGRRTAPRPRNRSAEWAPNHQLTGTDDT